MSSREIAEIAGKQHDNVFCDIEKMLIDLGVGVLNFEETYIHPQNGQQYKEFKLDRDLTEYLLTGYSDKARMAVIKRWCELESQANRRPPDAPGTNQSGGRMNITEIYQVELTREEYEYLLRHSPDGIQAALLSNVRVIPLSNPTPSKRTAPQPQPPS